MFRSCNPTSFPCIINIKRRHLYGVSIPTQSANSFVFIEMGELMKLRHFVGLLLVAAITSLAWPADSQAFPRRGFYDLGPNYSYSYPTQLGGGIGMGASYYGMPGWGYGAFPSTYSPYTAPYPLYNILPPGYPHGFGSGYGTYGWMNTYGSRRTAEDYGYSRDYFYLAPPRRTPLYPAPPHQSLHPRG